MQAFDGRFRVEARSPEGRKVTGYFEHEVDASVAVLVARVDFGYTDVRVWDRQGKEIT